MQRRGLSLRGLEARLVLAVIVPVAAGCLYLPPPPPPVVVKVAIPDDHTKDKHGIRHHPEYEEPAGVCGPCHGRDLKGTDEVRGCYACHRKNWD